MSLPEPLGSWEGRPVEEWRAAWELPGLLVFDAVESTNDLALALAAGGAPAGTTVLTDHQTRGRGQRGREWQAPPGQGVLLSTVLRPAPFHGDPAPGTVPLRVGMAAASALQQETGLEILLKWPNDVVAGGGKLGGILCEGSHAGERLTVVAGVGVNVLQSAAELPAGLEPPAVSLATLGAPVTRARVAGALARTLAALAREPARPLSIAELREYGARDILRGREITSDGAPIGRARGLSPDGALLVDTPEGNREIRGGTVRPADGRYIIDRTAGDLPGAPEPRYRGTTP